MKVAGLGGSIKELKEYALIEGELYRRLLGGILSRCINEKEGKLRLEKLHAQVCGIAEKISLYRRMQRMGYYWPNMNKEAAAIQENVKSVSSRYTRKRAMLYLLQKIRGLPSWNT